MRQRDIRQARQAKRELAQLAAEPDAANDDDPFGDEAWRDAVAEANSGTEELNRKDD